jgi:Mn2+/Fe2+ NRAMP family transporter
MVVIQQVAAEIGSVTGRGIAHNLRRHYSPWLLRGVVTLLLVANIINLGADLGAMGAAVIFLGERLTIRDTVGIALITVGAFLVATARA